MTSTIIATGPQYTFGALTNRMTSGMITCNTQLERLKEAVATATAGYSGTPGTQFEVPANGNPTVLNLFGVLEDPEHEGQKGQDYSYAIGRLSELWTAFWADAKPYIEQLDNGTQGF